MCYANFRDFEGVDGVSLLMLLDKAGICASSGSACNSGSADPSHVLLAIGVPYEVAHGSLRLSVGEYNTMEEMEYLLEVIPQAVQEVRSKSPVWAELESGKKEHLL